ncbi:MAG: hypothetical protein GY788_28295 [bacterium]|nr:hypothetical protein [bacterium]
MSWFRELLGRAGGGSQVEEDIESVDGGGDVGGDGSIEADIRLCVWRVFGVARDFSDRPDEPPAWSTAVEAGPVAGDQLALTIGDVPAEMIEAERSAAALGKFGLASIFGGQHADKTPAEVEQVIDELYAETEDVEKAIRGSYPLWVTLELARPLRLRVHPDARHRWLRDPLITSELLTDFAENASKFLDVTIARLLPSLGDSLDPERQLFGRRRAYLLADGKAPMATPTFDMKIGSAHVSTAGWADLPFGDLAASLASLSTPNEETDKLVRSASRWLQAAMAESDDQLRRFLFAFFGLEILSNKVGSRVEASVVADLSAELTLPLEHLVWPAPKEADSPWRNLTFRFSMVAIRVSRETAAADVAEFKELAAWRNKLSHGSAAEEDLKELPAASSIALLRRYVALVMSADADGQL